MMDSARKPAAPKTREVRQRQSEGKRAWEQRSRQADILRALLSGASTEQLSGLMARDGPGVPNSVMLDLLAQRRGLPVTDFRPLPERAPETEPFVWNGPFADGPSGTAEKLFETAEGLPGTAEGLSGTMENGAAASLPAPLSASVPAAPVSFA